MSQAQRAVERSDEELESVTVGYSAAAVPMGGVAGGLLAVAGIQTKEAADILRRGRPEAWRQPTPARQGLV